MAEETNKKQATNAAAANTNANSKENKAPVEPSIRVLVQYIKDFSFENPNAPMSLSGEVQKDSKINITINVEAKPLTDTEFEVILQVNASAKDKDTVIFSAELYFGGVFQILNVPKESIHPMVMIECPRILFPFARRIISDSVRDGGFPALMIDPVDFTQLYRDSVLANVDQHKAQEAAKAKVESETKQ
ncbi:MAG: protein-export chaperone SecB [Rhizobiales bacterium]|nr:protein-export chaperone SecB [Hyphomicrobiales bacterium]NRB15201.1 protein-export chaperone SecB [Hyphomicrobiales bacterium]